jgi:hypothetical protein
MEECIRSAAKRDDPKQRALMLKLAGEWREDAKARPRRRRRLVIACFNCGRIAQIPAKRTADDADLHGCKRFRGARLLVQRLQIR